MGEDVNDTPVLPLFSSVFQYDYRLLLLLFLFIARFLAL